MKSSSLPASFSFSTTFLRYPIHQNNISENHRQKKPKSQHTLELSLEILLSSERSRATRLVPQEIQPEAINDIDDLFRSLLERLLLFFGGRVCANVDVVGALGDLSAVDFVDDVINFLEIVGVGDDLVTGDDVL